MVWTSISNGHRTPYIFVHSSMTAQRCPDAISLSAVVSFVRRRNVTFQQGNARAHVAQVCYFYTTTSTSCAGLHTALIPHHVQKQQPATFQTVRLALVGMECRLIVYSFMTRRIRKGGHYRC